MSLSAACSARCSWCRASISCAPAEPARSDYPDSRRFRGALRVHALEEIGIVLRLTELVEQEFDGVDRAHGRQNAPQDIHLRQRALVHQEFVLARTGTQDVDGRKDALIGHFA